MSSPKFPEPPHKLPSTPVPQLDAAIERLASRKDAWVKVGIPERIAYLRQIIAGLNEVAEDWVKAGCANKGITVGSSLEGEEWLAGPVTTVANAEQLMEALEAGGQPVPPKKWQRPDGQWVVKVFPRGLLDTAVFTGFEAEVWIEPGKEPTQGKIYREPKGAGKVALVLGAGNVGSIAPMDALYKLFNEDEVVLLKMNPVNEFVGPFVEKAFKCLIDDGFFAVVYGGADEGGHCSTHPKVDTLHVTGSDRTYDAIVWGTDPEEVARRKASGERLNTRPFSAELGCVTPVLVVPGEWSDDDLDYQARNVVGMVTQNASFNCNAAKVLVLSKGWSRKAAFLDRLRHHLKAAPPRKAYYPGAETRFKAFIERYPQAEQLGVAGEHVVPWTVIPGVPPVKGEYALTSEAFCGVLAVVELEATEPAAYMAEMVRFANDVAWGSLSCMVLVHPSTQKAHPAAFDQAIADLRFGGIAINVWAAFLYGLGVTTWGAFPGHTPTDIQSGTGVVHNTLLIDHPQKSVLRAPFKVNPKPVYFADHQNLAAVGRKMMDFYSKPSWLKLPGVALSAFKA